MPQPTEVVLYTQNVNELMTQRHNVTTNPTRDCTHDALYRDIFSLYINNFTTDNNGYYWCQVIINGSFRQPSQHTWFYAGDTCISQYYFQMVDVSEAQCVNVTNDTYPTISPQILPDPEMITTSTLPTATVTAIATTHNTLLTVATMETDSNMELIFYVIGILSALTLFLGTFVILILLMLVRKRQKEHKQRKGKSFACVYTNAFMINHIHSLGKSRQDRETAIA